MQDAADSNIHIILHFLPYSAELVVVSWGHVTSSGQWVVRETDVCHFQAEGEKSYCTILQIFFFFLSVSSGFVSPWLTMWSKTQMPIFPEQYVSEKWIFVVLSHWGLGFVCHKNLI